MVTVTIYIGNLPYSTSEAELKRLFDPFGIVASAKIIKDKMTGKSRGYGFVDMQNSEEAEEAIARLNGQEVGERNIRVSFAKPRREKRVEGNYRD